jgi:hypothetical protein
MSGACAHTEPDVKRPCTKHVHTSWQPYSYDIQNMEDDLKMTVIMRRNERRDRIILVMRHQKYHSNTYTSYPLVLRQRGDKRFPCSDDTDKVVTPPNDYVMSHALQRELDWTLSAISHNNQAVQRFIDGNKFIAFNAASEILQARYNEFMEQINFMR